MKGKYAIALAVATVLGALVVPAAATAHGKNRGCERQFDAAVIRFDEVFLARNLPATMSFYHKDTTQIGANGAVRATKAAVEANFAGLFGFEFVATFPEVKRVVNGCETAVLIVDFRLEIPSVGFRDHFLNTLTFVREHGRWQILADVSTRLPL